MKKILVTDFDKTLYCDSESLIKNIDKIKEFRAAGNLFVIATGRFYKSLEEKLNEYSIPFDYIILSHGAVILDKNKNLILSYTIKSEVAKEVIDGMQIYKDDIISIKLFDLYNYDVGTDNENITKISALIKTKEASQKISDYINYKFSDYVKSYAMVTKKHLLTEAISVDTDKSVGIEKILEIEGVSSNNVYTIGDGSNDVEMIEKYNGYAMKDSDECVLKIANKSFDNVSDLIDEII